MPDESERSGTDCVLNFVQPLVTLAVLASERERVTISLNSVRIRLGETRFDLVDHGLERDGGAYRVGGTPVTGSDRQYSMSSIMA